MLSAIMQSALSAVDHDPVFRILAVVCGLGLCGSALRIAPLVWTSLFGGK